jgi:hypothetical protein
MGMDTGKDIKWVKILLPEKKLIFNESFQQK